MVYYKGSFSYETLEQMSIAELYHWSEIGDTMNKEKERAVKRKSNVV